MRIVRQRDQHASPTHPGQTLVNPVVLDFSGSRPGAVVHVTRAAADALAKEGKGTKEVDVPRDVIPDLPPLRPLPQPGPTTPRSTLDVSADEVLAGRAARGDEQAFTALVDRHGAALHRHVRRMLPDPVAAEDVLQETLLAAWRGLPGFRGEAGVRTWLFAIARHQVFAVFRKGAPEGSPVPLDATDVVAQLVAPGAEPSAVVLDCALARAVEAALHLLPERQRSAWFLREVQGLSYLQIAAVLEVGPATVRGLLARARVTLCAALQSWR